MKQLLLLSAIFIFATAGMSHAQSSNNNRVLFEEFNSASCPPCAATDPIVELFEQQSAADNICVLKWHQDYPVAGADPFYNANPTELGNRANYYGVTGIPAMYFQGSGDNNQNGSEGIGNVTLADSAAKYLAAMQNYYQMSVKHSVIGDSVVVWVTVTTGATQPSATDLSLGVVVAERFAPYLGANSRPFHTDVALATIPPLAATGAFNNPFSQAANSTVTYRYSTRLESTWNVNELMAVAAIQSVATAGATPKPVYQATWDVPQITVVDDGTDEGPMPVIAGSSASTANYTLTNNTATSQTITVSSGLTTPGNYTVNLTGLTSSETSDSSVTIPAGGSATLTVSVASSGPALTAPQYSIQFRTSDTIGIGGGAEVAFGQNIPHAIVNQWTEPDAADVTELTNLQTSFTNSGYGAVGMITDEGFEQLFGFNNTQANDWSQFKTVIYDDGQNFGILDLDDTSLITAFLNNGGNFVLSSPEFAYYFGSILPSDYGLNTDGWMENVFQFEYLNIANGGYSSIQGVAGDPIGDKVSGHITITAPLATQTIYPISDSCFSVFTDPAGDTVGTRATGNGGKVFYSSFNLGNITSSKRDIVIKGIMDWFYGTSGVDNSVITASCSLDPVYPNPVGNAATISYTIPDHRYVTLVVQDMLGRNIATLVNQEEDAGHYTVPFDASQLEDGTYVCTLTAGDFKAYGKMTVNR